MGADVLVRNNVTLSGDLAGRPMVFAHGFGCDQNMWRYVAPAFEDRYRTVLFDYVGAGASDLSAYDPERYGRLDGYAADVTRTIPVNGRFSPEQRQDPTFHRTDGELRPGSPGGLLRARSFANFHRTEL